MFKAYGLSIFISLLAMSMSSPAHATSCPADFDTQILESLLGEIETKRSRLREARQNIRKSSRSSAVMETRNKQIELTTLRLEYWSKDIVRYSRKHFAKNPNAVCARLLVTDGTYLADFITLVNFYYVMPELAGAVIRYEDYR